MTNREAFRTPAASIARLSRVQGTMRRVGSLGISRLFVALLLTAALALLLTGGFSSPVHAKLTPEEARDAARETKELVEKLRKELRDLSERLRK